MKAEHWHLRIDAVDTIVIVVVNSTTAIDCRAASTHVNGKEACAMRALGANAKVG